MTTQENLNAALREEEADANAAQPYRSPRILSLGVTRWLSIQMVVTALILFLDLREWSMLRNGLADLAAVDSIDRLNGFLAIGLLISWVISAALFIAWLYRAYGQLPTLGCRYPRWGKGWTIGSWFVPILNLWRPLQLVNDVWRSGDGSEGRPYDWRKRSTPALLAWWWAGWLGASWLGNIAFRIDTDTLEHLRQSLIMDAAAQGVALPAGIILIVVVRRATARQDERATQLASGASPGAIAPSPG